MSKENDSWNQLTNYSESYMCNTFFETEGTKSTKNVPFTHVNILQFKEDRQPGEQRKLFNLVRKKSANIIE